MNKCYVKLLKENVRKTLIFSPLKRLHDIYEIDVFLIFPLFIFSENKFFN